jgi:hypothetical protein
MNTTITISSTNLTHPTNRKTVTMKKVSTELQEQRRAERAQAIAYARLIQAKSKEAQRKAEKDSK